MHASSLENMQKCYERYICGDYYGSKERLTVLDVGGTNVNGSYTDIFSQAKFNYIAAGMSPAEGVDIVLHDPCKLPFDDGIVDIVISGQTFENVEFFWLLFEEMTRIVKEDGWILLITPSSGPIHRNPVDCYRFNPDAYRALAKYSKIHLASVFHDDRGPWNDLVGVFSKLDRKEKKLSQDWVPLNKREINRYISERSPASTNIAKQSDEMESMKGEVSYLEVLRSLHDCIVPSTYFEIGVRKGISLKLAKCAAIAIDPEPATNIEEFSQVDLFRMPSDYFFEHHWPLDANRQAIDLAFIDGMHLFEFVLRDFINLEIRSQENTVIVVDDIFPNHVAQATRERKTQVWTGDVWKFLVCLREYRPDLELMMINTYPTGLLVIRALKKNNRILRNEYNPIISKYAELDLDGYKELILDRAEALSLSDARYISMLKSVRTKQ